MAAVLDTDKTPNGEINNLQVACIGIKCRCGECDYSKGDKLYICKHTKCSTYFYCNDCGPIMHELKSMKNHIFNINSITVLSINEIMDEKENTNKYQYGQEQLISLIGVERYNKIAPYFEKPVSLVSCNVPMCIMLVHELTDFYKSVELAVKAAKAVETVGNIEKKVDTASKIYQHAIKIGSSANMLGSGTQEWKMASSNLMEQLCTANNLQESMAVAAGNSLSNTMSMRDVIKAGSVGMGISTSIELAIHAFRVTKHEISFKEWCRLSGKTITRNTASLVGTAIGGKLGAIAGCQIGVTTATISAGFGKMIGGSVGIVSGIICGYVLGKTAEWIYEKYLPPNEQQAKKTISSRSIDIFPFSTERYQK